MYFWTPGLNKLVIYLSARESCTNNLSHSSSETDHYALSTIRACSWTMRTSIGVPLGLQVTAVAIEMARTHSVSL